MTPAETAPKLTGNRCICTACGQAFNRVSTFDKHRTGDYDNRRCLSPEDMAAKGWRLNDTGFWITGSGYWRLR